jgi:hypothetical protein
VTLFRQEGQCTPCPSGAICGNDYILGNQAGYWTDGVLPLKFYPCVRVTNPTFADVDAASQACPQNTLKFGADGALVPTTCGDGYTGPKYSLFYIGLI